MAALSVQKLSGDLAVVEWLEYQALQIEARESEE